MNKILTKHCLICNKVFEKKSSKSMAIWLKQCKYCSWSCYSESRKKYCKICGKLSSIRSGGKYSTTCSKECKYINQSRVQKKIRKNLSEIEKSRLRKINYEQQFRKTPTSIEKIVYEELKARGMVFETQKLINGRFCVDAFIPSLNLIIEVDGNYWHTLDKTIKKDRAENAYLKTCGYELVRLPEDDVRSGVYKQIFDEVLN